MQLHRTEHLAAQAMARVESLATMSMRDDAPLGLSGASYYLRGRLDRIGVLIASAVPAGVPLPHQRPRPLAVLAEHFVADELQHFRARLLPDPDGETAA